MDRHDPDEDRIRSKAYQLWLDDGAPEGRADDYWHRAKQELAQIEARHDSALEDSFPASDPPATGITGGSDAGTKAAA